MTENTRSQTKCTKQIRCSFSTLLWLGFLLRGRLSRPSGPHNKKGCEMQSTFKEVHEHSPCLHSKTSFFKSETSGYLTGTPGCTVLPAREGSLRLQCPFQAQALFHCRWLMIHQCFSSFSKLHQLSYPGVWPATSALYSTQCSQQT